MSSIPSTQRALIFEKYNGPLEVKQISVPSPKDDELLVRIKYSGVCHSDLHAYIGDFEAVCKLPLIGGHEGAGEVVSVGKNVHGWKIGDRAGVKCYNANCLNCEFCKQGHEALCGEKKAYGFDNQGTYQEYTVIRGVDAIKISPEIDLSVAAPILCAGVTVFKALKESKVRPGQIVVLTGAGGGLGSLGIQYAKAMGMRVLALDHPSKEQHCRELGAEWFVDAFNTPNIVKTVLELTKGGPHGVVNLAVAKKPMEDAVLYTRRNGTIVLVALPKDGIINFNTTVCIFNALTIKGSIIGSRHDVDEALEFVQRGVIKVPLKLIKLQDVESVYKEMTSGTITSRAVVDFSL